MKKKTHTFNTHTHVKMTETNRLLDYVLLDQSPSGAVCRSRRGPWRMSDAFSFSDKGSKTSRVLGPACIYK